jgi:hypothetical protein
MATMVFEDYLTQLNRKVSTKKKNPAFSAFFSLKAYISQEYESCVSPS